MCQGCFEFGTGSTFYGLYTNQNNNRLDLMVLYTVGNELGPKQTEALGLRFSK